jgi:ribosomal protein S18 acetylase RimI-like enzyme
MEISIVAAAPTDAGEVLTVQRAAFLAEGALNDSFTLPPLTETLDEVRAAIDDTGLVFLVARQEHRLVGSVRGRVTDGTGHVSRLSIAPDLQGQGLGRRLMTAIEQALAGQVQRFELFTGATSAANLALYHKLGYVDCGWGPGAAAAGITYLEKRV